MTLARNGRLAIGGCLLLLSLSCSQSDGDPELDAGGMSDVADGADGVDARDAEVRDAAESPVTCEPTTASISGNVEEDLVGIWRGCIPDIDEGWHYCDLRSDGTWVNYNIERGLGLERVWSYDPETQVLDLNHDDVNAASVWEVTSTELVFVGETEDARYSWRRAKCGGERHLETD